MTDKIKMLEKLLQRWEKQPDVMLPCAGSHTCGEVAGWIRALRAAAASPIADFVAAAGEYRPSSAEEIAAAEEAFRVAAASAEPVAPIGYISEITLRALKEHAEGHGFIVACAGYDTAIPLYAHPAPDAEIVAALEYISAARFNEEADLDDICTRADRALAKAKGARGHE